MTNSSGLLPALLIFVLYACSPGRNFVPGKKIPKEQLQKDYSLMRKTLESNHPSLYWYTSKDSLDMYFDRYYQLIGDSMTEQQFSWRVLAPVISKVRCGHTSIRPSKDYEKWSKQTRFPVLPLNIKVWNDSMAVFSAIGPADSVFKRGTVIKSINGMTARDITRVTFDHMHTDGFASNFNYIRLSSAFPYYHRNIFGLPPKYKVTYTDSSGSEKTTELSVYRFNDSLTNRKKNPQPGSKSVSKKKKRSDRLLRHRSLKIDSTGSYAVMAVNTFSKGKLHPFFRKSFRKLDKRNIEKLVIDLRINGGGKIAASTLLSRYVTREPFRIADTVVAFRRSLGPYTKYAKGKRLNNWGISFMSKKTSDGSYHIKNFEKKIYKPVRKHHFDGKIIVLTSGPTFSASTLFCNLVKGQPGITLMGEETGGGWYGNNGILIPDITMPNTGIRFRLPLFRVVQYRHVPKDGRGITPDIYVGSTVETIRKGTDRKMEVAVEMMRKTDQKTLSGNQAPR